ncbi:polysaccharide deacetylase family protein [Nucisporomicrobium flavum]|jgi:peptidoglycan/xylan/chitin deacetylase (PgdA/CDA1 family)|uniref:polysaccharide deacetylase family protein n=1 Tax=Nucisporomicrobium flavum TaxID=2785915 RepID=UPI001F41B640|nr:polysaccharide deacetylase family protein [Nucisporomicrobium flavum]
MRTPKVLVIGLALAGVAGLAGCGSAMAAERSPAWVAASPSASTSRSASPSPSSPSSPTRPAKHAPAHSSSPEHSASSTPSHSTPASRPAHRAHHDGPADSLMKTGQKGVALTFDDGPDPAQTPKLLDLLKKRHVKATFCLVGQNVAAHPALVRRIAAEGHTLCNHTWRHSLTLGKKKPSVIRADLQRTNDAIRAAAPGAEIKYMRAPGGNFTPAFVHAATDLGMTSIYWQVDPRDWDHPAGESDGAHQAKVIKAVKKHVSRGAIVLSHDYAQPDTIAAYETLIPWLQRRYKLIALP